MKKTVLRELNGRLLVRSEFNMGVEGHTHEFWNSREDFEMSQAEKVDYHDQDGTNRCRVVTGLSDIEAIELFESLINNSK